MIYLIDLPLEILQIIFDKLDFSSQIIIQQQCRYFYEGLRIYDLYNISIRYKQKLNDIILQKFKHVKYLDASFNKKITDNGIEHLNLHKLCASNNENITDKGIKHMDLYMLNASYITKSYYIYKIIKNMNLYLLNASDNKNITDNGIKHMKLHILNASGNKKITNEGIKYMDLHLLFAWDNKNITEKGIKHMKIVELFN